MTGLLLRGSLLGSFYLIMVASLKPLDILIGLALGAAVLVGLRDYVLPRSRAGATRVLRRVLAFPRFAAAVVVDIVRGTIEVSLVVLGLRALAAPGVVEIPIGERTPRGVAVSGLATTLSPGAVLIDVDFDRGVMLLHVLDAADPDAVRAAHERFYRDHQRAVFP